MKRRVMVVLWMIQRYRLYYYWWVEAIRLGQRLLRRAGETVQELKPTRVRQGKMGWTKGVGW